MADSRCCSIFRTVVPVGQDVVGLLTRLFQSHARLAAENLFLRKQLALYLERQVKPRRASDATRLTLVALSSVVDWSRVLTIAKPDTFIRWHRQGYRCCGGADRPLQGDRVFRRRCSG